MIAQNFAIKPLASQCPGSVLGDLVAATFAKDKLSVKIAASCICNWSNKLAASTKACASA